MNKLFACGLAINEGLPLHFEGRPCELSRLINLSAAMIMSLISLVFTTHYDLGYKLTDENWERVGLEV